MILRATHISSAQINQTGRSGALRLRFARHNNKTAMVESYFRTPLQVMRAIPDTADCLCVYMLSPTGGIVQHDRYAVQITLEADTHALISTVAATKVYRMPDGKAIQQITIDVGENATLEFVPDALILFKDADFEQIVNIRLAQGALCIFQDSVLGGRTAYQNEIMQFRHLRNHIEVTDDKGLILYDSMDFRPTPTDISRTGVIESYRAWGSWYVLGDLAGRKINVPEFCQQVNNLTYEDGLASISELHRNGIAYRILANRLESLDKAFEHLRGEIRQAMGIPFLRLRK